MKERPIIFNSDMVLAILEGRKTQTRRPVNLPVIDKDWLIELAPCELAGEINNGNLTNSKYGRVGDLLYVKESAWMWCERIPNGTTPTGRAKYRNKPLRSAPIYYVSDHPDKPDTDVVSPNTGNKFCWCYKAARFMPRWACRIIDGITNVRVERLQDISEQDAIAEGCLNSIHLQNAHLAYENFSWLWQSIYGDESWSSNPWVWVIEFKVLTTNGQIPQEAA